MQTHEPPRCHRHDPDHSDQAKARPDARARIEKLEAALRKWHACGVAGCLNPAHNHLHPIAAEALGMALGKSVMIVEMQESDGKIVAFPKDDGALRMTSECLTCRGSTTVMATRGPTPAETARIQCPECRGTGMTRAKEEET